MKNKSKSLEDLDTIRTIMENSTKFLSLSGLSGVFAGLIALAGVAVAYFLTFNSDSEFLAGISSESEVNRNLVLIAIIVLISAITVSFLLSRRKADKRGLRMWTPVSRRLLVSMIVPLMTGGILIIILYLQNYLQLIIPSMLIFYGLALVNAGKFTYGDLFYLGMFEIVLGLGAAIIPQLGIIFWAVGFGFLHIAYGLLMYRKYER